MKRMRVVAEPMDIPYPGPGPTRPEPTLTDEQLQQMEDEAPPRLPTIPELGVLWDAYLEGGGSPTKSYQVADIGSGLMYNIKYSADGTGMDITYVEIIQRPESTPLETIPHLEDGTPDWASITTKYFPNGPIDVAKFNNPDPDTPDTVLL